MAVGEYTVVSGTAGPTEQDTVARLDEFLTGALGWSRLGVLDDTTTDNDRVWYSPGEVPGKYSPLYIRARGTEDSIFLHAYTLWSGTGNDELSDASNIKVSNANSGGADDYVFIGNKDAFFLSIRQAAGGGNLLGGAGYLNSYYTVAQDKYPVFITGQTTATGTYADSLRLRAYGFDPDGFLHAASTLSGAGVGYIADDFSSYLALATPNRRDNRHLMMKQTFYRRGAEVEGGIVGSISHEVRGELPAVYQFYGSNFIANDRLVASGVATGDGIPGNELGTGDFIVARGSATNAYAIGPVNPYTPLPLSYSNLHLWLKGATVERQGGSDEGGAVREWIDLSGKRNPPSQGDPGLQPIPAVSGTLSNQLPIVSFDGTKYLTGKIEVVDSYTVFAVARYSNGASRAPLFYTRGEIFGSDTIIGLEFNPSSSDSAEIRVRTSASPLEEDIERYSGLTSGLYYVVSAVISGSTDGTTLYVNGHAGGSTTVANTKTTISGGVSLDFGVGTSLDTAGSPLGETRLEGDIAEVIVYSRALPPDEHQSVVCYLGGKYAISVSGTC